MKELEEKIMMKNENEEKKKYSRDVIIQMISRQLKNDRIEITKRSNKDGGGILLTYPDGSTRTAMLRKSRNYVIDNPEKFADDYSFRCWHVLRYNPEHYITFDIYIFAVENDNNDLDFFVLPKKNLELLLEKKEKGKNDTYHFYFAKSKTGDLVEDRDTPVKVNPYFNSWEMILS